MQPMIDATEQPCQPSTRIPSCFHHSLGRGGGGRQKITGTAVQLFFRGYPRRGGGGVRKKFAQIFFPDPKT